MKTRALLIEDDPAWREILNELLLEAGFQVHQAELLADAETLIRAQTHKIAVVDLSLVGPDHRNQDGLKALDLIARCDPACQSILLTGYATVELAVQVITEGKAKTCLRKENFSRAEFRLLLQQGAQSPPLLQSTERPAVPITTKGLALVVEDDAGWRALLEELLVECGFKVIVASSFAEARGHLEHEHVRLAIVDFTLASSLHSHNQDGLDLLAVAREGKVPAIVVSGTSDTKLIERSFREHSVAAFFEKQEFNRQAFRQVVLKSVESSELDSLTEREREVLNLLADGLTNQQIAERLTISANTVKRHLKTVFDKLGVNNRAAAAALVTREG